MEVPVDQFLVNVTAVTLNSCESSNGHKEKKLKLHLPHTTDGLAY